MLDISQNLLKVDCVLPDNFWEDSQEKINSLLNNNFPGAIDLKFVVGDFVFHPLFGSGVITSLVDDYADVVFDDATTQCLHVQKLSKQNQ